MKVNTTQNPIQLDKKKIVNNYFQVTKKYLYTTFLYPLKVWVMLPILVFFPNNTFAQESDKDLELKQIESIEAELRKEKERISKTEKELYELKSKMQKESSPLESKDSYVSPMKEKGLSPEFTRSMFLDPEHNKEMREGKKLWLNDFFRVGFWMRPRLETRQNLDFNSTTDDYMNRALQASQIWFIVDPNPYLSFKLTIIDARVMGGSSSASTGDRKYFFSNAGSTFDPTQRNTTTSPHTTDVREAFFILKSPGSPLKFVGGRQILSFGDNRMLGGANWNTNGHAFDGMRFVFESQHFDSHLFVTKMTASANGPNGVLTANGRKNGSIDDSYLVGKYSTLKFADFLLDFYAIGLLKKWIPATPAYTGQILVDQDLFSNARIRQNDNLITGGFRITNRTKGNFLPKEKNWDWAIESAFQAGFTGERQYASWDQLKDETGKSFYSEKIKYTGQFHVIQTGYTLLKEWRIGLQYTHSSGDQNRKDGSHSTFQLLPNPRFGIFPYYNSVGGLAENISMKNINSYNINISYKNLAIGEIVLSGFIHKKAVREDAWYAISGDANTGNAGSCILNDSPTSSSTENCTGNSYSISSPLGKGIYNEINLSWAYHWREGVSFWAGAAYLHAGDSIRNARTDPFHVDPAQRYTFKPNAYTTYFMINIAM